MLITFCLHLHDKCTKNEFLIWPQGLVAIFFIPRLTTLKTTREECQIFIQRFFKIVLYWCLDLICRNVGTPLKLNKYIFDIHIPFCYNLYLSATFKQFLTEFAGFEILFHVVYMWEHTKFLCVIWLVNSTNQIARAAFTCKQQCWGKS